MIRVFSRAFAANSSSALICKNLWLSRFANC